MPKILNKSPRQLTVPITDMVKATDKATGLMVETKVVTKRIVFKPLILETVTVEEWKKMKTMYLVKKMLDEGELLEGAAANRESIEEDDINNQMKNDLSDDELATLTG